MSRDPGALLHPHRKGLDGHLETYMAWHMARSTPRPLYISPSAKSRWELGLLGVPPTPAP